MSRAKIISAAAAAVVSAAGMIGVAVQEHVPEEASELVQYQIRCNLAHAAHDLLIVQKTKGRMAFTDGEAYRPEITAQAYARMGRGVAASLHTQRLARDKMLFIDGKFTDKTEDHQFAGEEWEKLGPAMGVKTAWGGRFVKVDGNHYSCAWGGLK